VLTLHIQNLQKRFRGPDGENHLILDLPELSLEKTEQVALRGESGSGKSTLLHLIAGILTPDRGSILLQGQDIANLPEARRDRLRARHLGIVFQTFNLLQGLTVLENVMLGMAFSGTNPNPQGAEDLLRRMGLAHRLHHHPRQLSSGQQQRVAVARALAGKPSLVLADEPTGNLDPHNATEVLQLLQTTCRETGAALLLVSHDPAVLNDFERIENFAALNQALTSPTEVPQ
jgi:putative ABC transport system ATP-binding protein